MVVSTTGPIGNIYQSHYTDNSDSIRIEIITKSWQKRTNARGK